MFAVLLRVGGVWCVAVEFGGGVCYCGLMDSVVGFAIVVWRFHYRGWRVPGVWFLGVGYGFGDFVLCCLCGSFGFVALGRFVLLVWFG